MHPKASARSSINPFELHMPGKNHQLNSLDSTCLNWLQRSKYTYKWCNTIWSRSQSHFSVWEHVYYVLSDWSHSQHRLSVWECDCPELNDITFPSFVTKENVNNRHSVIHVRSKRHQIVGAGFERKLHHVLLPGKKRNSIFSQFCCRISNTTCTGFWKTHEFKYRNGYNGIK